MERHVDVAAKKVDDLRARAETCRKAIELLERVHELEELLEEANKPKKKEALQENEWVKKRPRGLETASRQGL